MSKAREEGVVGVEVVPGDRVDVRGDDHADDHAINGQDARHHDGHDVLEHELGSLDADEGDALRSFAGAVGGADVRKDEAARRALSRDNTNLPISPGIDERGIERRSQRTAKPSAGA